MRPAANGISVLLGTIAFGCAIGVESLQAQIVPNPGDTNTTVTAVGNRLDIGGGILSGDNANLFHSLSQFGLTQSQIANFLSNPSTRNILVRVTGGDASRIDGLVQVSGSNANLFLMNPAGIVFGGSATLNVAGSFTATTATGIGFGTNWFNASGTNNYAALTGDPTSYAFAVSQPGSIVNAGYLSVGVGQQITLLGGTVVSSGGLSAPDGQIIVAAVPGQSIVRLSQPGDVLSLEVQRPTPADRVEPWTLPVLSLPELLTGGSGTNATGLTVNAQGQVVLTGSGVQINPGDSAVRQATTSLDGLLQRAVGSALDSTAFPLDDTLLAPSPASRFQSPPPDQFVPTDPVLDSLPLSSFLRPSVRMAPPPDSTLPSLTVPDCGAVCPQSLQPPTNQPSLPSTQTTPIDNGTGNTSSGAIVNFSSNNQTNPVVILSEPLPQYDPVVSRLVQPVNPLAPPEGDPKRNLEDGAIDDMNQAAARARRLAALKKYLQQRWKATPQLTAKLQYRLRLDDRGTLQQVLPADQEATTYLANLQLTPVSNTAGSQTVQSLDVMVILSPDGTVDVISTSQALKN